MCGMFKLPRVARWVMKVWSREGSLHYILDLYIEYRNVIVVVVKFKNLRLTHSSDNHRPRHSSMGGP